MEASDLSRPWTVEAATFALLAALMMGLIRTVFGTDLTSVPIDPLLFYGLIFGSTALAALILHKIWSRRNWARIVYTLSLAYGLLKTAPALVGVFEASFVNGFFSSALITVKIAAVVLLFLPSSNMWFRHRQM